MGSREKIFADLNSVKFDQRFDYPTYAHPNSSVIDPYNSFATVLESVGGECHYVRNYDELKAKLVNFEVYETAKNICSCLPEIEKGNIDLNLVEDVHELHNVDLAIASGDFGVAENGAVWVNGDKLKHRGLLFLAENLILVIESGNIVNDLNQAYDLIDFENTRSGYFISGPSKTADIEQCLVIGAHGARSLIVFVIQGDK